MIAGHTGTPVNVQNNCIKFAGFGDEITTTWTFSTPENNEKNQCREEFFNSKIRWQFFRNNIYIFIYIYICVYLYIYLYTFEFKATKVRNVCRLNEN